jgi:hypothetical protein
MHIAGLQNLNLVLVRDILKNRHNERVQLRMQAIAL